MSKKNKQKARDEFNKLTEEQKAEIIKSELQKNIDDSLKETVPKIIANYFGEFNHDLYERFVVDIEEDGISEETRDERVQSLIDYLIEHEARYQVNKAKEAVKEEGAKEDGDNGSA